MNKCFNCEAETTNAKYCSRSCAVKTNNTTQPKRKKKDSRECASCGVKTYNAKYCTNKCQYAYTNSQRIDQWLNGDVAAGSSDSGFMSKTVRNWMLEQADHKCTRCGWNEIHPLTGKCPLEVDHVNGDPKDNRIENLRVLCPNCHCLTPTSKALNSKYSRIKYGLDLPPRENSRPYRNNK